MDSVEEIKDRLDASEVVSGYVQLKQAGANFRGLCPFHHEKTPSFMVSDEKGIFHCFGCGEGGDIFTFVEKIEGVDFKGALEILAKKAGVSLPERGSAKGSGKFKERLYEALELATKYFQTALVKSPKAQNYIIKQRGFNKEAVTNFRLGFAPAAEAGLSQLLKKKGFNNKEIIQAGLARQKGNQLQDIFRGRMMVPFADGQGRIVGFTGRVLDDGLPKYMNSPQSPLFDKSRYVFGLFQAKETIRRQDQAILVEGNLDVITAYQYGFKSVVATSGTALTAPQLKSLSRLSRNVALAFDQDAAGLIATERAIPIAQNTNVALSIITLEGGKDPDELIRKDQAAWQRSLDKREYVMDWLLRVLTKQYDSTTGTGAKQIADRYATTLGRLSDPVEQDHYVQALAKAVNVKTSSIWRKLGQSESGRKPTVVRPRQVQAGSTNRGKLQVVEEALLSLCVLYPDTRVSLDEIQSEYFSTKEGQKLADYLRGLGEKPLGQNLPKQLQEAQNYVKILLLVGEQRYRDWAPLDRRIEAFSLSHELSKLYLKEKQQNLQAAIAAAEVSGNQKQRTQLLKEFRDLKIVN